jgi:3-hydroxybutyryl-CoA dehydrogenase
VTIRIGVIGAGVMGSGIAQTTATAGYETTCCDLSDEVVSKAQASVRSGRFGFERAVERGKISREDAEAAHDRLTFTTAFEAAAAADLIVECVPEKLDLKIKIIRQLDEIAPQSSILASNTSGFPIAALAAATQRPERVIGWHWASPPVVMKFAEIVVTEETAEATTARVTEVAEACGKHPVVVKDNPMAWGFVANRVYGAMLREAARVVDEGVASHEEVNQLMVDCFGWPVGPFAMVKGAGSGWQ